MTVHAIVLAAGRGTRMKSDLAKVLHRAAGRTLLDWVLAALAQAGISHPLVVVGHQAEEVRAAVPGLNTVLQEPQNGTGHAVEVALAQLPAAPDDTVLVVYGDMPLVPARVYAELAARPAGVAACLVTVDPGPPGFGRILRGPSGRVSGIVEERDCDQTQLAVTERNAGLYAFAAGPLREAVASLAADNAQGELYLTDVVGTLAASGAEITTIAAPPAEMVGVNSHIDLAQVEFALRSRINRDLMSAGVWMLDPERTYVEATVTVAPGARLYPGTHLRGATSIGPGAEVGPDALIVDSDIGEGATVSYSVLRQVRVAEGAAVGPYASLRPGTVLERGAKAGSFVEMKKTVVGEGAKVPHLSYLGDATVGKAANIGAGTITCNYDGYEKYETVIGEGAFIGSDTMLVAPVTIGAGAVTGAGSVITRDVEPGALAVGRSPQADYPGYAEKKAARRRAKESEQNH